MKTSLKKRIWGKFGSTSQSLLINPLMAVLASAVSLSKASGCLLSSYKLEQFSMLSDLDAAARLLQQLPLASGSYLSSGDRNV